MIAEPRTIWNKSLTRHAEEQAEREQAPEWTKAIFGVGRVPGEIRETVKVIPGEYGEVWLECEVVSPQSTVGRTVDVHIPAEQVLAVLKACRDAAAAQREKTLS